MFGIGVTELIIVLVIVLIIFGANKLPKIGEGLGKGIRNFKKALLNYREKLTKGFNYQNRTLRDLKMN